MTGSGDLDARAVVDAFDLGRARGRCERVATGWGGHNVIWRLHTSDGMWAIKQVRRALPEAAETAFAIEMDAYSRVVPMPRPVASRHGCCYEAVDGTPVRCHEWMEGTAKTNEQVGPADAWRFGRIVARLHSLRLAVPDGAGRYGRRHLPEHWVGLADARGGATAWCSLLRRHLDQLMLLDRLVQERDAATTRDDVVGSHRDLNAHNVLFRDHGQALVDWDSAGPAWPRFERAVYPVLWAQRHGGGHDTETALAFLRGYLDGGGVIEPDDVEAMWDWLSGLVRWTAENLRIAAELRTPEQDRNASHLLAALLRGEETLTEMQAVLHDCLRRL